MNRIASGTLLQYLGLVLVLGTGWWAWRARFAEPPRPGPGTVIWVLASGIFIVGTTMRLVGSDAHRKARIASEWGPIPTVPYAEGNDPDALALTPELFAELRASKPWVRTFGILLLITTVLVFLVSGFSFISSLFAKNRPSMLLIAGGAAVYAALATLYLTLLQYVRQHKAALDSAGAAVSEFALRNVVDSQRRILRYFGVMLWIAAAMTFLAVLFGVIAGGLAGRW